jgi:hypothetical protein
MKLSPIEIGQKLDKIRLKGVFQSDNIEIDEKYNTIEKSFRSDEYFESRIGEEDDDFPIFTGKKEVIEEVIFQLGKDITDNYNVQAHDQEKSWFTIVLSLKKKT